MNLYYLNIARIGTVRMFLFGLFRFGKLWTVRSARKRQRVSTESSDPIYLLSRTLLRFPCYVVFNIDALVFILIVRGAKMSRWSTASLESKTELPLAGH